MRQPYVRFDEPMAIRVTNKSRSTVLVKRGQVADSMWARLLGLIGQRQLEAGGGLLLRDEKAIHTFGMSFAIDVAYLDRDGRVLRSVGALPPLRLGPIVRHAQNVLELPAGTLAATDTHEGDLLIIEPTS